ncbi:S-adenosyl-L-methionine-dependent methyltransferase [Pterulicium gracile]|uniref:S-adenosyl-L-methionine-dependent methyltransferase n=1 Tax=Pterulicium gracile TaxID=1884261 RepID=A0A5C3R022_9AGAR|nr:S-adenosyl-L-methionine-dependent methyltransferase [Pterula gracilis]
MIRTLPLLTGLLLCLAHPIICFAYFRIAVPLYGDAVFGFHFDKVILAAASLAALVPIRVKKPQLIIGLLLAALPYTSHGAAVLTSRRGDPAWGPVITHVLTIAPIVFLSSRAVLGSDASTPTIRLTSGAALVAVLSAYHLSHLPSLVGSLLSQSGVFDSTLLSTSAGVLLALDASAFVQLSAARDKKKKQKDTTPPSQSNWHPVAAFWLFLLPWLYVTPLFLHAPVLHKPLQGSYQHPTLPVRILSAEQSITGTIVVGEGLRGDPALNMSRTMQDVRYLRADHSIIGGVWTGENVHSLDGMPASRDSQGTTLGDSIYGAFVLQEAARLAFSQKTPDDTGSALIIGLGAGVAASAFQKHGLSTSIIEIDPAVYTAARTYFGLEEPNPDQVFLEDAGAWVSRRAALHREGDDVFDIVVHDCFSGGGVPEHIFTIDFWTGLKTIMNPEGVLAVNFAGIPASSSSRAILLTLEKVFGTCRAFHDMFEELKEPAYATEFINIVFFCSPSGSRIHFRSSRLADYLNSPLRQHVLGTLFDREVNLNLIKKDLSEEEAGKLILTKENNPLNRWQAAEALHHWSVMREVLSDFFWETY